MQDTPNLNIPNNPEANTAEVIDRTFDQATEYMKTNVSYIWNLTNSTIHNWTISTWSKYVSHGLVEEFGTESDKQHHKAYTNFRCLPRKKNRKAVPSLIDSPNNQQNNNNHRRNHNNNNHRRNNLRTETTTTKRRRLHAEGENIENDLFGAAFAPDPLYLEAARIINDVNGDIENTNEQNELEKEEQNDQSNVEVHTDLGTNILNTATTAVVVRVNHSAAWASTILDAAGGIDSNSDSNNE